MDLDFRVSLFCFWPEAVLREIKKPHCQRACLRKPIIQTIGCKNLKTSYTYWTGRKQALVESPDWYQSQK